MRSYWFSCCHVRLHIERVYFTSIAYYGVEATQLVLQEPVPCPGSEPVRLSSRMWSGGPSDRSGVSSTVHILVHLLGHLLSVTKVGGGDSDPAERDQVRPPKNKRQTNTWVWNRTHCIMTTMLWTLMVCSVQKSLQIKQVLVRAGLALKSLLC